MKSGILFRVTITIVFSLMIGFVICASKNETDMFLTGRVLHEKMKIIIDDFIRLIELGMDYTRQSIEAETLAEDLIQNGEIKHFIEACEATEKMFKDVTANLRLSVRKSFERGDGDDEKIDDQDELENAFNAAFDAFGQIRKVEKTYNKNYIEKKLRIMSLRKETEGILEDLNNHVKSTKLPPSFLLEPIRPQEAKEIDDIELRTRGTTLLRVGNLFLESHKEMRYAIDKLEELGYYKDGRYFTKTLDENIKLAMDAQLESLQRAKENIFELLDKYKEIVGPNSLFAYAQAANRLMKFEKIPKLLMLEKEKNSAVLRLAVSVRPYYFVSEKKGSSNPNSILQTARIEL